MYGQKFSHNLLAAFAALLMSSVAVGAAVAPDQVAATMGSWRFILVQSTLLIFWIAANITAWIQHWDPYPFILLNLALSFQAAYAAPFIMMSQNRHSQRDREMAEHDYEVNLKAEIEILALHDKLEQMRVEHTQALINGQAEQMAALQKLLEQRGTA